MPEAYWSSMKEELEQQQREIDQKKKQENILVKEYQNRLKTKNSERSNKHEKTEANEEEVVEQDEINQEKQKGQEDKAPAIKKFIPTKERTKIVGAV